ncbi:MAG: protein phosphatase [Halioglobus sp.]|nr:protein phosphatase [Halioglobus sp.]
MKPAPREFAADTHAGLVRNHNEDCFAAEADLGLWLVADGVGGHAGGEVASGIVRDTVRAQVAAGATLPEAILRSHEAVLAALTGGDDDRGMGSTVVALRTDGDDYELCWVGDSRAYLWNGQLRQLTEDHSRAGELLASNAITAAEANTHPERHVLTQSLGVSGSMSLHPGRVTGTLKPGDHLLLCSDGLTDELSDSLIAHLLGDHDSPRSQVDALMSAALDAGGKDNVTVLVVGAVQSRDGNTPSAELETTKNTRRSASGGRPNDGKFPLRALALVTTLALLAVWLML